MTKKGYFQTIRLKKHRKLSQNEVIENELRIRGSPERKTINTPGNLNQTISTLTSFQSVDHTAEEESGYPAPPDRSAAEADFRN